MTLAQLLNQPCTITRRADGDTTNRYGNNVDDAETIETVCELQQRQRSEDTDGGELGRSAWLLVLPAGTDVRLGDAVTIDGTVYEVQGEPWQARNPRTGEDSHVEATLERTAGTADHESGS